MQQCKCGSFAINHNHHGRDGSDPDLCDVCYWRKRAVPAELVQLVELLHRMIALHEYRNVVLTADMEEVKQLLEKEP